MDSPQTNPLLLAAVKGDSETVNQLIGSIDAEHIINRDVDGRTALIIAAMLGHLEVILALIPRMKQADLSLQDTYGETALMYAAWEGHIHVVNALLPHLDDEGLLKKELNDNTALMCAANNGKNEVVKILLPVFLKADPKALFQTDKLRCTALMLATINGHTHVINEILSYPKESYDLKSQDFNGETALMIAIKFYYIDVVKALLLRSTPAELNLKNNLGHTPLMIATFMKSLNLVSALLPYLDGAALDKRDDYSNAHALMLAVAFNRIDLVKMLIPAYLKFDRGVLNEVDIHGKTILMNAAEFGYVDIVKLLLSYKDIGYSLDLNKGCLRNNENALMLAAFCGRVEIVKLLLPLYNLENLKAQNRFGQNALIIAAIGNHFEIVRILAPLYDTAGLNHKDKLFFTAFIHAAEDDFVDVVNALLPCLNPEDFNESDNVGLTALMWAAWRGNLKVIEAFISKLNPSQVNKKSRDGRTALILAAQSGHFNVVELLLDYKADVTLEKNDQDTALSIALTELLIAQDFQRAQEAQEVQDIEAQNKAKTRVKNYRNIVFRLLDAMTPAQLAAVKISRLGQDEMVSQFETKLLKIQKEIYQTLWSLRDTQPFGSLEGLAGYLMQFCDRPIWYHHRMDKDVTDMTRKMTALLEKRPKMLSFSPPTKRPRDLAEDNICSTECNEYASRRSSRSFERTM